MPADQIRVVRQAALLPDQAERFCAINDEAFPPSERVPCSVLQEEIADGRRWLFTASDNGSLVGYAVILPNVGERVHLLEFLAVDRGWRSKGVGGRLLEVIHREVGTAASGILIEVESDEAGPPEEQPMRRRRIRFYVRHGFQLIDCPFTYFVPSQMGGENVTMKLMWLGWRDVSAPSGYKLLACITGIYAKSYYLAEDSLLMQAARSAFESQPACDS